MITFLCFVMAITLVVIARGLYAINENIRFFGKENGYRQGDFYNMLRRIHDKQGEAR